MANRTMFTKLGLAEPGVRARPVSARQISESGLDEGGVHPLDETATTGRRPLPAEVLPPEPESTTPLLPVEKSGPPTLDAPRPVTANNDAATAVEDGPAVVVSVLNNDVGVAGVARINGVAVTPGGAITLQSGARVIVNANGTLSYEVGTAFQSLGAGQTAQDVFTYAAADGGGSPLAPEGVFNAAAINGTNGFVIHGAAAGDRSGYSVAGIGDINGDGHDDLLIGALSADLPGGVDAGISYVVYGRQGGFGASLDLAGLTAATGFAITGVNAFDYSGASVRKAGDVNGDGLADFLIGAPWGEAAQGTNAGETYLVFGRQGGFGAGLDLSTLNGATGVTFRGGAAGDGLGFAVSSAGDINGDGFDDLILGAREADGGGDADAGSSYVVFGRAGGFGAGIDVAGLTGANGFAILGADPTDRSGYSVAAAGDVNGDGIGDLIIGAPQGDPGGRANAGEAYVVFGRAGGFGATLDLGSLTGADGFTISGIDAGDHAGWSVASAGDLNGDGRADLVIGALYADPGGRDNAGETYVVFGRAGGFGANLDLSSMPAAIGFTITGTAALNLTGHSVSSAGDVNGDGVDDLLIGALYADGAGGADAGETYVVFGRQGGFGAVLDLASLNGQTGFAIGGATAGEFSGHSVSAAGDVNGDGFDDLIIGAPMASPSGRTNAGLSYVLFGAANVTRLSNDATVTVTVTGTNDAPVITSNGGGATGGYTIVENTTGPNTVAAFDPDAGATLTYSIIGGADAALFAMSASGVVSLVNPPNFEAPADQNGDNVYEVIVQVSDGSLTDTQTINLTVTNANEAPVITSGGGGPSTTVTSLENSTTVTTVVATDPDTGASLAFSILAGRDGARFAINATTGALTFIAAPNFEAPTDLDGNNVYEVDVQVSDGLGGTDVQTVFVNVGNVNEAPVITSNGGGAVGGYTIFENTTGPTTITAFDPDVGANLTYTIVGGADAGLFGISVAGVLSLINPPNFEAPADQNGDNVYQVIVQVSDGTLTDTQTINLTVTNANEAPVITSNGGGTNGTVLVAEGARSATTVTATDPDAGAQITYSITGGADAGRFTIDPATGAVNFVTNPDFELPADSNADNNYDIVVQASDGVNTDTQNLRVTVTDVAENTLRLTDVVGFVASNEGDPFVRIDSDVTFTDVGTGYSGGNLTVSGLNPTDLVSILNLGNGPGQIGVEGSAVSFGGVPIGTITTPPTGSYVVTFNAGTTRAAIETLVEALQFRSTSDIPVSTHALFLQITNALGEMSAPVNVAVQFTADILNGTAGDDVRSGLRGNDVINGFDGDDILSGGVGDDMIVGGNGIDKLNGGEGNDTISGDAQNVAGVQGAVQAPLSATAASYYTASHNLVTGLGGARGFGEQLFFRNDDSSLGPINITSVFGAAGMNFFGTTYTSLFLNNNGNITFNSAFGGYTPSSISAGIGNPLIAAFWTDIDTRNAAGQTSPGGTSQGTNQVYYDLDTVNGVLTFTWDDVGQFPNATVPNAFQIQLISRGGGDFDIIYRYEDINWGTNARAGYNSGTGTSFEFASSGTSAMLDLENTLGNTGIAGVYVFNVRDGVVTPDNNDVIDGGAGMDRLIGGLGDDDFIFHAGQANGDVIVDFIGNGAAAGDELVFRGYGTAAQGATFVQLDATHWQINSADGTIHDVITIENGGAIHSADWRFEQVGNTAGAPVPSVKGGGPEICYGPDDVDGGEAGPPQVLPGVFDKAPPPPLLDDLGDRPDAPDFFPAQDHSTALSFRLADAIPLEPLPFTAWDDGFS